MFTSMFYIALVFISDEIHLGTFIRKQSSSPKENKSTCAMSHLLITNLLLSGCFRLASSHQLMSWLSESDVSKATCTWFENLQMFWKTSRTGTKEQLTNLAHHLYGRGTLFRVCTRLVGTVTCATKINYCHIFLMSFVFNLFLSVALQLGSVARVFSISLPLATGNER